MKQISIAIIFTVILTINLVLPVSANSTHDLSADISVPQKVHFVGDPIMLTVEVTHPVDQMVIYPNLDADWGDFSVISQRPGESILLSEGYKTTTQLIDVRAFRPGLFETPSLLIKLSDKEGNLNELTIAPLMIEISSVLVEGDEQLRDIKPQAVLPTNNLPLWIGGSTLALVTLLAATIYYRHRRNNGNGKYVDPRLPHEVALQELERIEMLNLPEKSAYKQHYTLVADCLKRFIQASYQISTTERTTIEIAKDLKAHEISTPVIRQFISILAECDLVKFSKFQPDSTSAKLVLIESRETIETTISSAGSEQDDVSSPGEEG